MHGLKGKKNDRQNPDRIYTLNDQKCTGKGAKKPDEAKKFGGKKKISTVALLLVARNKNICKYAF